MAPRLALTAFAVAFAVLGAACGAEIGDSCSSSTDCSPEGDRVCDGSSPDGYCTVEGCDFDTCPSESICVRFFPALAHDMPCTAQTDCEVDETCTLEGFCAQRSTERRFCMRKCGDHGDCRADYECRDTTRMMAHGGEPVSEPDGTAVTTSFCAASRPCSFDTDCDLGDTCSTSFPAHCVPAE